MRLGERAFELGRNTALARITRAVTFGGGTQGDAPHAPAHWIEGLVGISSPDEAPAEAVSAIPGWLSDERTDAETVRDVLAAPQA